MKKTLSLAALFVAVATLAGCCGMCGGGDKKPKKTHHKKGHGSKHASMSSNKKKPVKKHESEFQKVRREADRLMEEL